jgi:hypothetical protein
MIAGRYTYWLIDAIASAKVSPRTIRFIAAAREAFREDYAVFYSSWW